MDDVELAEREHASRESVNRGEVELPGLVELLMDVSLRIQGLARLQPSLEARLAIPPLIAMLKRVSDTSGAAAEAATALAQCMADSAENRRAVDEFNGAAALIALLNSTTATPEAIVAASHAVHMLLRSPENCASSIAAGVIEPLTRLASLSRGEFAEAAIPSAGSLCHLAESSAHARSLLREAGSLEPLTRLVLIDAGESAAAKFAGHALFSFVHEEPQVVVLTACHGVFHVSAATPPTHQQTSPRDIS